MAGADLQTENDNRNNNEAAAQDGPDDTPGRSSTALEANDIQILDLHGEHPVISYQNQIYHCTWSDLIGTAMFFSKAETITDQETMLSTGDFQLLNTSRIKLIGQKAKLTGKPGRKRRREQLDEDSSDSVHAGILHDEDASMTSGKSLGEIRTSNPKINAGIKRQAAFLEKLMEVKRAKGESDNVRTVFRQTQGTKIIQPPDVDTGGTRQRQEFLSISKEIEALNRRVVRGDASALMRLQDIYSSIENETEKSSSLRPAPAGPSRIPDDTPANTDMPQQRQTPNE